MSLDISKGRGLDVAQGAGGTDISDADAAVGEVLDTKTFYSVAPPRKTGILATVAITSANDDYPAGYHAGDVGGLDAIDTDLATANIKSGVTIFGKAGSTDVRDSTDANAAVGNVLAAKTFYAGGGAKKTGTMTDESAAGITITPSTAKQNLPASGYWTDQDASVQVSGDADLVTGSIKSGVNIFGVAGAATVQDIADANLTVAEAPTGKKFYAVTGGVKTGTGTKTLDPASETVAAGYYAATTLSAVDADLTVGNIKSGVTIFGKLGTLALAHDIEADGVGAIECTSAGGYTECWKSVNVNTLTDLTLATLTQTYAAGSLAEAYGFAILVSSAANKFKMRLYMDGTQVAESGYVPASAYFNLLTIYGYKALSGSKIVLLTVYNYDPLTQMITLCAAATGPISGNNTAAVFSGSVKAA